jgi:pimeloyl-ACP methyl ester carboxylesterase
MLDYFPRSKLIVLKHYGSGSPEATYRNVKEEINPSPDNPVMLIGHSMGGIITRRMAVEEPEGVAGYVSIDSPHTSGLDKAPFKYPLFTIAAALLLGPHLRVIQRNPRPKSGQRAGLIGSVGSEIAPESSLDLGDLTSHIGRILFTQKSPDIATASVEERLTDGETGHVGLVTNPDVLKACAEILGIAKASELPASLAA